MQQNTDPVFVICCHGTHLTLNTAHKGEKQKGYIRLKTNGVDLIYKHFRDMTYPFCFFVSLSDYTLYRVF